MKLKIVPIERNLDDKNRVRMPSEIVEQLGLNGKDTLEVYVVEQRINGKIRKSVLFVPQGKKGE